MVGIRRNQVLKTIFLNFLNLFLNRNLCQFHAYIGTAQQRISLDLAMCLTAFLTVQYKTFFDDIRAINGNHFFLPFNVIRLWSVFILLFYLLIHKRVKQKCLMHQHTCISHLPLVLMRYCFILHLKESAISIITAIRCSFGHTSACEKSK